MPRSRNTGTYTQYAVVDRFAIARAPITRAILCPRARDASDLVPFVRARKVLGNRAARVPRGTHDRARRCHGDLTTR